jgi:hypothetical protein
VEIPFGSGDTGADFSFRMDALAWAENTIARIERLGAEAFD